LFRVGDDGWVVVMVFIRAFSWRVFSLFNSEPCSTGGMLGAVMLVGVGRWRRYGRTVVVAVNGVRWCLPRTFYPLAFVGVFWSVEHRTTALPRHTHTTTFFYRLVLFLHLFRKSKALIRLLI
jgi:hypothetical protein